jgi:uncharacterized protein YbaR (Trm112 family)
MDPELLELLACPACKSKLDYRETDGFSCATCGRRYPVQDGIPVFTL